ncbi:hypothetical protein, partial [Haliscomenobacter sp.]|uniref:hypothetical protein n=1 Tax=Haliscomenobacter sp. TaxID=2717303 RepID=UPI00336520CF
HALGGRGEQLTHRGRGLLAIKVALVLQGAATTKIQDQVPAGAVPLLPDRLRLHAPAATPVVVRA